ncbi:hypothetical protein SAMN06298211_101181 [Prevotellaceae bacterium MN60]|nr:hypothetical protein SAMN06298211_101181 [Prevotellaceae bacterium MN60]
MKGIIIAILLFVLPCGICHANGARFLIVNAKDGTKTTFALAEEPKVSLKSGELSIASNSRTFIIRIADVKNYAFAEESSGIGEIIKSVNVKVENGCVIFSNLMVDSKVSIYIQDGKLLKEVLANTDGTAFIDLSTLPKGILILHSDKMNIKVVSR